MSQTNFENVELQTGDTTPTEHVAETLNGTTTPTAPVARRRRRRLGHASAHGHQADPLSAEVSHAQATLTEEAPVEQQPSIEASAAKGETTPIASTGEATPELSPDVAISPEERATERSTGVEHALTPQEFDVRAAPTSDTEDLSEPGQMAGATEIWPDQMAALQPELMQPESVQAAPQTAMAQPELAQPVPAQTAATSPQPEPVEPAPSVEEVPAQGATAALIVEPPRPPRRYRFDRPAPAPVEETAKAEPAITEAAKPAPSAAEERGAISTSATETESVTPPADAEMAQAPESVPETEVKPASKRRQRRRRRSSTASSQNGHATANERPAESLEAPAEPREAGLFTGFDTSNTFYQPGYSTTATTYAGEVQSPFASPEPAPARGFGSPPRPTTLSEARAARSEGFISGHAARVSHTSRSGEVPPLSTNQLAAVFTQAIQNQTDRLLAELRRNQSPPSMTVTFPPFPSTERVGIFVDVANLLYSARNMRITIDFGKLLDFLRGNRRLVRAHAYCPTSPDPNAEQTFLMAVKGLGYRITTKNYKTFSSGAKKADLDLDLCMDVVRLVDAHAVDCIVLVSGDSDFLPLLDYCSEHGVRVEVAAFDEAAASILRQSCDLFINLSVLQEIRA
jgi:uncharacterized LabA/DUF88 family protein